MAFLDSLHAAHAQRNANAARGFGDPEIQAMNAAAPLLDLIQRDTGEQGHDCGDYVSFDRCPVCGHRDCMRYVRTGNYWQCFSASNGTDKRGGGYSDYLVAAHRMTAAEAVAELRRVTGNARERVAQDEPTDEKRVTDSGLRIVDAADVTGANTPRLRPAIIEGVLRTGGKLAIIGPPKSHKSMEAICIAFCIATGRDWRGHRCERARVLYVNTELQADEFAKRCEDVRRAMGIDCDEYAGSLSFLTLTGHTICNLRPTFETLREWLEVHVSKGEYGFVIIDPLFKLVNGDENSAADVNEMLYELDQLRVNLDATIAYCHHTSKGGAAFKSVFELGRGSSNFGGDADAVIGIVELTVPKDSDAWDAIEEMGIANPASAAYEMQFGLRSFADPAPIRLIKRYPQLIEATDALDALHLRGDAQAKGGEANRQRVEDENAKRQAATRDAVTACTAAGNDPTRKVVHELFLRDACRRHGIKYPALSTFTRWTSTEGCTTYRVDQKTYVLIDEAENVEG